MSPSLNKVFVYILECRDDTHYTGITGDIFERLRQHYFARRGYTSRHRPSKLIYLNLAHNRSAAAVLERVIKRSGAKRWFQRDSSYAFPSNLLLEPLTFPQAPLTSDLKINLNLKPVSPDSINVFNPELPHSGMAPKALT